MFRQSGIRKGGSAINTAAAVVSCNIRSPMESRLPQTFKILWSSACCDVDFQADRNPFVYSADYKQVW